MNEKMFAKERLMKKRIVILTMCMAFLLSNSSAFAYTECVRTVSRVWITMDSATVWVAFNEGYGSVFLDGNSGSNAARDRLYTMALTALTTNKKVIVRYPEDNADCSSQPSRRDHLGMWISN